jgi:hypothetical protein
MGDKTWKAAERRMAKRFGTTRIPAAGVMGHQQRNAPDFVTPRIAVQNKRGYSPPSYLRNWLRGIGETAEGRIPVVIWAGKGVKDDDALVFLTVSDFQRLLDDQPASR